MNFNIPTYLSDFSTQEDGRTIARLKVLYVGETADGRVFDKEFSESLSDSLADAPVVAYYSDIKKDFLGHNRIQYVFGHVPSADNHREFVEDEEDKKTWLMTDVILYTDRTDNIGEIAKKIVGHAHSLELDPKTVSYEMVKENGQTKIHFKKGRICGLSVLGTDEKPAFTGSAFLNCSVNEHLQDMREKFETFFAHLEEESRGGQMNENVINFESLANNAKISYTEQQQMVFDKFMSELGDEYLAYIIDFYDDTAYFATCNWETGAESFQRVNYTITEDAGVTLSNLTEVFRVFVTAEEKQLLANQQTASSNEPEKNPQEPEVPEEPKAEEADPVPPVNAEVTAEPEATEPESTTSAEDPVEEVPAEGEEHAQSDNSSDIQTDVAALYESARVELETLKTEKAEFETIRTKLEGELAEANEKLNAANVELDAFKLEQKQHLINSYKEDLSEEVINDFNSKINDFSYTELESQLALSYSKAKRGSKANKIITPLDFNVSSNEEDLNKALSYEELVNKWKNK